MKKFISPNRKIPYNVFSLGMATVDDISDTDLYKVLKLAETFIPYYESVSYGCQKPRQLISKCYDLIKNYSINTDLELKLLACRLRDGADPVWDDFDSNYVPKIPTVLSIFYFAASAVQPSSDMLYYIETVGLEVGYFLGCHKPDLFLERMDAALSAIVHCDNWIKLC